MAKAWLDLVPLAGMRVRQGSIATATAVHWKGVEEWPRPFFCASFLSWTSTCQLIEDAGAFFRNVVAQSMSEVHGSRADEHQKSGGIGRAQSCRQHVAAETGQTENKCMIKHKMVTSQAEASYSGEQEHTGSLSGFGSRQNFLSERVFRVTSGWTCNKFAVHKR